VRGKLEQHYYDDGTLSGWSCDMEIQMDMVELFGYQRTRVGERAFLAHQNRWPEQWKLKLGQRLLGIIDLGH
jgi:hypothetical protein